MKKAFIIRTAVVAAALLLALPAATMAGDLTDFVKNLSIEAKADLDGFKARLQSQFNIGPAKVDLVLSNVADPADAYMALKVGEVAGKSTDEVLTVYNSNRDKGWGFIAKEMGIKPGSAEFHALKSGPSGKKAKGKGKKK